MREQLAALAQWWSELPTWAKRFALKLSAAGVLVGAAHVPYAPVQDVMRELALEFREQAGPAPLPPSLVPGPSDTKDAGAA